MEEKYPSTRLLGHVLDRTNYNGYNIEVIGKTQDGNLIVQESLKTGALLGGNLNTFYQDIKDNGGTPGTIAKIGTQDSWGVGTNYVVGTNTSDIESKILNQKLSDVKVSGYNLAVLGCAATAGGCILLGNDLGSDINDMLHPDKAGSYNSIRGTIETGIKLTGLPKEYQGLVTDVAYFGVSSKLASTGKWENVSNTLNSIKIPGLGGSKEVVVTDSLGNTYKVKPESVVDDLANNKVLEASKNKGSNLGSSNNSINNTNINSNQPNGEYFDSPKHAPGGWGTPNPIKNNEIGQQVLNNAYKSSKTKQVYTIYEGKLIKFQPDPSTGQMHPYEVTNSFKEVPNDVLRQFRDDGLITKTQYNKYVKNK